MGKIENYTIYCKVIDNQNEGTIEKFVTKTASDISTVKLAKKGTYKIWITAFTSAGESPKSNEFIIQSEILDPCKYFL